MTLRVAPDFEPEEHFGPSRLKKARQCPTAEALHYVVGLREPELLWEEVKALPEPEEPKKPPAGAGAGQLLIYQAKKKAYKKARKAYNKTLRPALGKEGHARLESYYAGGSVNWYDRPGKTMLAGLHYLPVAKSCEAIEPEQKITLDLSWLYPEFPVLRADPLRLQGTRDLAVLATGLAWSAEFRPVGVPLDAPAWVLMDHKTTLTFDFFDRDKTMKTVRTPDELRVDEQVNMYGLQVMQAHDLTELRCRWIYYRTEGAPDARAVDVQITREGAEAVVRQLVIEAMALRGVHRKKRPWQELPKHFDSCPSYGGCIYDIQNGGPCPGAEAEGLGAKLIRASKKKRLAEALKAAKAAEPKPEKKARQHRMAFAKNAAAAGLKKPGAEKPPESNAEAQESASEVEETGAAEAPESNAEAQESASEVEETGAAEAPEEKPASTAPAPAPKAKPGRKAATSFDGAAVTYNGVTLELPAASALAAAVVRVVETHAAHQAALNGE